MKKQKHLSLALLVGTLSVVLLGAVVVLPAMSQDSREAIRVQGTVISNGPGANPPIPWQYRCFGTWQTGDPNSFAYVSWEVDNCINAFGVTCTAIGPWVEPINLGRNAPPPRHFNYSYFFLLIGIPNHSVYTVERWGECRYTAEYLLLLPTSIPATTTTNNTPITAPSGTPAPSGMPATNRIIP